MNIPLLDLKAHFDPIRDEINKRVGEVFDSNAFINGPQVAELEKQIAQYCNCNNAVGVSSGTDALLCSLMTADIGPGDEVITTPFSFFSTAGSIRRCGATPVFADIERETFNIAPSEIKRCLTACTKAIIPVHLFGQPADMDPIMKIASENNLFIIEDAAQAIGAEYKARKTCSFGTTGCLSFFPTKNLGGFGDGGMVLTQDEDFASRLKAMRNHGSWGKYSHEWVGGNFRLDTIQAAGLLVNLKHLATWTEQRRENARFYNEYFNDVPEVECPTVKTENTMVFNQYVIRARNRDALQQHLKECGIGTAVYYPISLHLQKCFSELGYAEGDLPQSEQATREVLALPIYPELQEEQLRYVAEHVKEFYNPKTK